MFKIIIDVALKFDAHISIIGRFRFRIYLEACLDIVPQVLNLNLKVLTQFEKNSFHSNPTYCGQGWRESEI